MGHPINLALMLGGFSECKLLLDAVRQQFAILIVSVDQASVAIVKGATLTSVDISEDPIKKPIETKEQDPKVIDVEKSVRRSIGL